MSNNTNHYSNYHWCGVPACKNTSIKTPGKLWILVPLTNVILRKKWFEAAGRDTTQLKKNARLYFCEDHFDLENDMENYMRYKIMGAVKKIKMKPHCVPSKFLKNNSAEAKRRRKKKKSSSSQDIIQYHQGYVEEDIVQALSCIEDSQSALDDAMENECVKAVQIIQIVAAGKNQKAIQGLQTDNTAEEYSASQETVHKSVVPQCDVIIVNVYRYLMNEYLSLYAVLEDYCDLSPFSNILKRTADATGVSEYTVAAILERENIEICTNLSVPVNKQYRNILRRTNAPTKTTNAAILEKRQRPNVPGTRVKKRRKVEHMTRREYDEVEIQRQAEREEFGIETETMQMAVEGYDQELTEREPFEIGTLKVEIEELDHEISSAPNTLELDNEEYMTHEIMIERLTTDPLALDTCYVKLERIDINRSTSLPSPRKKPR